MNFRNIILTTGTILVLTAVAFAGQPNLIKNGNFEKIEKNNAIGWHVSKRPGVVKTIFPIEKGRGHVGQITFEKWSPHGAYISRKVKVKPRTHYKFSLKACMSTGNIRISISGGKDKDKVSISKFGRASHLSMFPLFWDKSWSKYLVFQPNKWRTVTIDFDSGNAKDVYISFGGYQRKGIYLFDDVQLIEVKDSKK